MKIHELFPYLRVKNAARAIDFYRAAFGVTEKLRLTEPSGRIGHAELEFGSMTLNLHVEDADAMIARAVEAGASVVRQAADHFYGERSGTVRDPFGHEWLIGHEIEKVTPAEMQRRYDELMRGA